MKFEKVSDATKEIFDEKFATNGLNQIVSFTVLHNSKMKSNPLGFCGKIFKTADIFKAALEGEFSGTPDFIIVINEDVFNLLDTPQQFIIVDKLFAQMGFDFEKSQYILHSPDIQEFSGILKKYSFESIEAVQLAVESIYQSREENEDDKPKKKRGRPRKNIEE